MEQKASIILDQMRSPILVTGGDSLLDRFSEKFVLLVPLRSAAVQLGKQLRMLVFQTFS